jgi:hypothetical protein
MFQLVKSKEARRDDGEHYTSETNILKTIGPLFLDELRAEADRLIAAPASRDSIFAVHNTSQRVDFPVEKGLAFKFCLN